jgi:hypothetical protein
MAGAVLLHRAPGQSGGLAHLKAVERDHPIKSAHAAEVSSSGEIGSSED